MIDEDGFRANVAMVICNDHDQVLWARRFGEMSWQFPQGGMRPNESPEEAMLRELREEVGTDRVEILGRTRDWLRYEIPYKSRSRARSRYRGQKQIWFLLRFLGDEREINLATAQPEFDDWRWVDYWAPINEIIEFKRKVYLTALCELAPALGKPIPFERWPAQQKSC